MKKIVMIFLTALSTTLPIIGYPSEPNASQEHPSSFDAEKYYIDPSQLAFINKEIWAYVNGTWISIQALFSDEGGLYIHNYPWSRWICRACGYNNAGISKTCQRYYPEIREFCNYPRPE